MSACPACGAENPEGFKFCGQCGATLSAPPAQAEERKVVTTLFCDLVAFTAMSEAADPEDVDALLGEYFARATKAIESHGGTVEKFIGDAVVGVFGVPAVHEDDPERAIRAGLRLLAALEGMLRPDGTPLQARVGINTGEALVRLDVDPASGRGFLTGDAVNVAARLEAAAPPGGVVVGELTHTLTEKAFRYQELEPATLKGKSEAVKAWLALEPVARTGLRTSGLAPTPFVGREQEFSALQDALTEASSTSEASFILLIGEPGIGKSRLVLEMARTLHESPGLFTWRQGRCLAYGESVPFWALGDILKMHAGILDSDDSAAVKAKLETVLPEGEDRAWLRQRLRPLLGLEAPQASREESFAAWRRFLELLAAVDPTVLVIEDLHWADEGMLSFVHYLAEEGLAAPLLVLATTRPELLEAHPNLFAEGRHVRRLLLPRLTSVEVGHLVSSLLEAELTEDALPFVERLGGNPLYAEEYARLLLESHLLPEAGGGGLQFADESLPLPATVQAVIAARLDALPPGHKALLCDAAVIGEAFWRGGVAVLSGRSEADVEATMADLGRRQLVRPTTSSSLEGDVEYLFWHALARDVAYSELPRKMKAHKHRAAALWIERQAGEQRDDFDEIVAHHYVMALDLAHAAREVELADSLLEPAIRFSGAAGNRLLWVDLAAAERHLARALDLAGDRAERLSLLTGWGQVLFQRGRNDESIAVLREAADGLEASGDRVGTGIALFMLQHPLQLGGSAEAVLTCADGAVELLDDGHASYDLVRALAMLAWAKGNCGDQQGSIEAAERAIDLAREWSMPVSPGAIGARGSARLSLGDLGGLEDYRFALEVAAAQGSTFTQSVLTTNLGFELLVCRGPADALELWRSGRELNAHRGIDAVEFTLRCCIIEATAHAGRWGEALDLVSGLDQSITESADVLDVVCVRMLHALILLLRGDRAQARELTAWGAEKIADASPGPARYYHGLVTALSAAEDGDSEVALALLDGLSSTPLPAHSPEAAFLHPNAIRAARRLGDVRSTERLVSVVDPVRPLNDHVLAAGRALLAESAGELERAADEFAAVGRAWRDFGVPFEEGQALLGQGRCLLALGQAAEAARPLAQAREIFERLRAKPALTEVDRLLEGITPAPH
jgi:class 3 adenylate cyclase/tetratricopeptide (TPR) repeat protein